MKIDVWKQVYVWSMFVVTIFLFCCCWNSPKAKERRQESTKQADRVIWSGAKGYASHTGFWVASKEAKRKVRRP